jgi:uncharacterized protein YdeI (YjbR/CyaY-like superfamily)
MSPSRSADLPVHFFAAAAAFDAFLAGTPGDGLWVKFAKKGSGVTSMTYAEAVDVALCHGWIDGQVRSVDETYYLQRFTPRRKGSIWSRINVDKVARLIETSRMRPAGLAEVERAKADGRWQLAAAGPASMEVPAELSGLLAQDAAATAAFAALDKTNRYAFCYRVATAVKVETRLARAQKAVEQLRAGVLPYPARAPSESAARAKKGQSRDS